MAKQEEYIQGRWYWFEGLTFDWIARFNYYNDLEFWYTECYDSLGVMLSHDWCCVTNLKGLATPSQIETCLKAYAEKNGYLQGAKVKSYDDIICLETSDVVYGDKYDILVSNGNRYIPAIYEKGKWAEIVAHAPQVQDKQDNALTERIHEFVKNKDVIVSCPTDTNGNCDLSKLYVCLDQKEVTLKELCETYYKMLDIKTVIGGFT